MMVGDAFLLSLSLWASVVLRYGELDKDVLQFWWLFPTVSLLGVFSFYKFGLYRAIVRYIGPSSMLPVIQGVTIAAVGVTFMAYLTQAYAFPRSSPAIFWFVSILTTGGSRIAIRTYFYGLFNNYLTREPIAIYGAGQTGAQLAIALLNDSRYMPVAFIDDNRSLRKQTIHGIRVYDSEHVDRLVERLKIKQILLAVPSATPAQRKKILDKLSTLPVHIRTVPTFGALISGKASVTEISEVEIGDLLGRDVVPAQPELLSQSIAGKSVLVTGAGGTIGSELCRKIIEIGPRRLVLFDNSEFALYSIENELQEKVGSEIELVAMLGSILNEGHLTMALSDFGIETVYHAAAYKHVHMVERNIIEGVRNNVVGTWNVVKAAAKANRVSTFVLISSDKAVRPTNVMGATKRLAELIVQAYSERADGTRFCMVRFGNVLRSSGSVVPIFEQQILKGGPVEVTHRDATRYFMTASEAAELVIQAGAMSSGGEVFVLDMGEPVPIYDLAEKMIHLHGLEIAPEGQKKGPGQVSIRIIGLRPGEKLVEELVIGDGASGTTHSKILKVNEDAESWDTVQQVCGVLRDACEAADYLTVKQLLEQYVSGYQMIDAQVDPLLAIERERAGRDNVTPFPKKED
ncbi:MAG: polysaccharide biosynthesis protein [Pseudomonadales bacterium]|nr:polysaccharide biosynthesis protein [Pseudomonadales bacterium]